MFSGELSMVPVTITGSTSPLPRDPPMPTRGENIYFIFFHPSQFPQKVWFSFYFFRCLEPGELGRLAGVNYMGATEESDCPWLFVGTNHNQPSPPQLSTPSSSQSRPSSSPPQLSQQFSSPPPPPPPPSSPSQQLATKQDRKGYFPQRKIIVIWYVLVLFDLYW